MMSVEKMGRKTEGEKKHRDFSGGKAKACR